LDERKLRMPIAGSRRNHESLTTVRHAQAVLVVVTNDGSPRWQHAGEWAVEVSGCKRFDRRGCMDRLAVLGANPMCDERNVGKGNDLREDQQATNGPTPPSPRFHGSYSQGKHGPMHGLLLTPRPNEVKARSREQRQTMGPGSTGR
jgi:hypothetical protein